MAISTITVPRRWRRRRARKLGRETAASGIHAPESLIWQIFSPEARRRRGSAKPAAPSLEREQLYIVFAGPRENSDIIVIYSEFGNIELEN
jgi:hypothetical protein